MADKPEDDFAALFEAEARGLPEEKRRPLALGERVRAEVVQVGRDGVFVELLERATLGKRPQAFMHHEEVRAQDGTVTVKVGDVLDVVVVELAGRSGELRVGRSMGRPAGLDELATAHAARVAVEGKVSGVNKGGLEVEVAGVRAFCPISHADRGYVADPQALIGRSLQFLVTELGEGGQRVVLSRRALLEQEHRARADQVLSQLTPGAVVHGTVTAVREFGAFVDLGGIEGLIPNAELSHDRSARAADVLTAGDAVEVQVREIKPGAPNRRGEPTVKLTLSLKALAADPWDAVDSFAPVGKVLHGSVTRVAEFGAFVRLAPGVEGLLHVSELSGKVGHPSAVLKPGDSLHVVVRSVDRGAHRIALAPAPDGLAVGAEVESKRVSIGSIVHATVDHIEPFGIFVQLEGTRGRVGRGLIPNAELGTARGADTRKLFPEGKKLSAKVLETGEGKLRLSIRALKDDEERAEYDGYRASASVPKQLGTLGDLLKKK
jgi:small subunit ribosomal protein S1